MENYIPSWYRECSIEETRKSLYDHTTASDYDIEPEVDID
jgi:hypothetical protein